MNRHDKQPQSKKKIEEHQETRLIQYSYGLERRTVHVRGNRENVARVFYRENGSIDLELTMAQAIVDTETPADKHISMYSLAEEFLRARGERSLLEFCDLLADADFGENSHNKYFMLAMLWSGKISEKYGAVSQEAIAAQFISSSSEVIRLHGQISREAHAAFNLCQAWHLWASELNGEHGAAFRTHKNQANLQKAGPVRSKSKERRLEIIRQEIEALWTSKPNYRNRANTTASNMETRVNERLTEIGEAPYRAGSLEKVVGTLIRSKRHDSE